jgi:hypothetical protein
MRSIDLEFVTIFYSKLSPENEYFVVERTHNSILSNLDEGKIEIVKVNDCVSVTNEMIRQFSVGCPIRFDCMLAMLELFKKRDYEIFHSYCDVNSTSPTYRPFATSVYFEPSVWKLLLEDPNRVDYETIIKNFDLYNFSEKYRLYYRLKTMKRLMAGNWLS